MMILECSSTQYARPRASSSFCLLRSHSRSDQARASHYLSEVPEDLCLCPTYPKMATDHGVGTSAEITVLKDKKGALNSPAEDAIPSAELVD